MFCYRLLRDRPLVERHGAARRALEWPATCRVECATLVLYTFWRSVASSFGSARLLNAANKQHDLSSETKAFENYMKECLC